MITRMTRYHFLLYHAEVQSFMEKLGDLGVVDITLGNWEGNPEQHERVGLAERLGQAAKQLKGVKPAAEGTKPFPNVLKAVEAYEEATERLVRWQAERLKAEAERDELAVWGNFDPALLHHLEKERIHLRFFEVPAKQYNPEWENQYPLQPVAEHRGRCYFVAAEVQGETLPDIPANELKAPSLSLQQKELQINELIHAEEVEKRTLSRAAMSLPAILDEYALLREHILFTEAFHAGTAHADGSLKLIEGWSEAANREQVEQFAEEQGVIYLAEKAEARHNPPVKLRNHFFGRLFEPVANLYMLPRYNELDLTPFFAPFFMIFFGMCFGDAGYGILLMLAIGVLWRKVPRKYRDFLWLGLFLNFAAVLFGLLTGNVFGIELAKVPALVEFKQYFLSSDNLFNVAVGLGAVQVLFGQILRVVNRSKRHGNFLYGLSSLGWVLLFVTLLLGMGGLIPSDGKIYYGGLIAAGVLILFFNSPKKNPLINVGAGLYNCYEMATGVVGDLISYVRLFAIGLAGGIIAQVFNALAVGLSGDIPVLSWIFMAVILVIGHGLNIFISALGAFVHPVRLTFVEFYKNAEFEGGSRSFAPLKRANNEN